MAFSPRRGLARCNAQQAIGIYLIDNPDTRSAGRHWWNAMQFESCQGAAITDQLALTLNDMQRQGRLAILIGGKVLRLADRNRGVARYDFFNQPTHGLDAQR